MDPSREYLAKIGEVAYLVAQLEWLIMDDIRLATTSVNALDLHGQPDGVIRGVIAVATSAKALINVAGRRNTVLHARPAMRRSGEVRLLKLRVGEAGEVEGTWIDDDYLDRQIAAVRYWLRRVESARGLPVD